MVIFHRFLYACLPEGIPQPSAIHLGTDEDLHHAESDQWLGPQ
jgi:hypothetical protein